MRTAFALPAIAIATLLAGCSDEGEVPDTFEVDTRTELLPAEALATPNTAETGIGTPMEERVATLGLLNKRNNSSQDIELSPGQSQRIGDIMIRLQACERTAPWEMQRETGAFVQVSVQDRGSDEFRQIFSGWLFKNSPSLNVVEHPIYDVWVKDCTMSFPGEE